MPFEVRVAELTLDGVERHALAGELQRVGGAQLMPSEPSPEPAHGATRRSSARAAAPDHGRYLASYQVTIMPRPRVWLKRLKPRNAGLALLSIPS
jgi:hypothetical protein